MSVDRAAAYRDARLAALNAPVSGEPEAQLTIPVAQLLVGVAEDANMGRLELLREHRLDGVRPDFAALIGGVPCGWVELKAPGHTLDGASWRGREAGQWELLAELDALLVTESTSVRLYLGGEQGGARRLPA